MIFSRIWYGLLAAGVAWTLAIVFVAVGEYNHQAAASLREGLVSDSQTVELTLELDARRRLDALGLNGTDPALEQALATANATKDAKPPLKARLAARKALTSISDATPVDTRNDSLFAVDRDGQVLAEVGYEVVAGNEDFELGGYAAVNDALHGWARADVWMLGSKMVFVVASPADYEAGQGPAGALVGFKEVTKAFVDDLAKRTRTNLVFYAASGGVAASAGIDGFDVEKLNAVGSDLKNVVEQTYVDHGRSDVRAISDDASALYARIPGDAWTLGGGFAVVRSRVSLGGPVGVLTHADDKARANIPWFSLAFMALFAGAIGIVFTLMEHTAPLRELLRQSDRLKSGIIDNLEVTRLGGLYRSVAENVNQGTERVSAKAVANRAPAPAAKAPRAQLPPLAPREPGSPRPRQPSLPAVPPSTSAAAPPLARSNAKDEAQTMTMVTTMAPSPATTRPPAGPSPAATRPPAGPSSAIIRPPAAGPTDPPGDGQADSATMQAAVPFQRAVAAKAVQSGAADVTEVEPISSDAPPASAPVSNEAPDATAVRKAPMDVLFLAKSQGYAPDTTAVLPATAELLAEATRNSPGPGDRASEWRTTFDDFIRTRKDCGESTHGITFEKFSQTLTKSRDALMASGSCKAVKFTVYVKAGKATLKATPLQ